MDIKQNGGITVILKIMMYFKVHETLKQEKYGD